VKEKIKVFFQLIKVTITLPVTLLSYVGYTIYDGKTDLNLLLGCIGVFALAGAASAINQVIEVKYDAMMERTSHRPIPSGRVTVKQTLIISGVLIALGIALLLPLSYVCVLLGLFNLAWYIGVYTLLKRVTPFAVIPGSLTGAIPVLIGYAAAGGYYLDPLAVYIAVFVFIWQIPHFWLLTLIYGDDYRSAKFPTLYDVFSLLQIRLWTVAWILAACIISLSIWNYDIINSYYSATIVLFSNVTLIVLAYVYLIDKPQVKGYRYLFHLINMFMVLILLSVSFEKIGIL